MKKIIRYFKVSYFVLLVLMFTAWVVRYSMLGGTGINPKVENAIIGFAEFPSKVHAFFMRNNLADQRYILDTTSRSGLNYLVDTAQIPAGKLLISTFDKNKNLEIKLLDLRKNQVIKKWEINPDSILHNTNTNELNRNNLRLLHPLLLKDSSLIFNTNYSLFKINKDSKIVWVNKSPFHHSIEYADDSTIWACGIITTKKPTYIFTNKDTLINSAIFLISTNTGKVVFQKSIFDLLKQNGYNYIFAIGNFENDVFHLNEAIPAPKDTKYWKKGDVLISLRNKSTVFLYRPSTNKVLWLKTGPWSNQHDCSFMDDEHIMVLGNDMVRNNLYFRSLYKHNNVYTYSFKTNTIDTPYNKITDPLKIRTFTEGRCNILPDSNVFFDDYNNGTVYIFNRDKLKLTYCERIDNKHVKMLNWVRYIPN